MMKHKLHFTCLYMLARLALPDQFYPQCIWWCRFVSMLSCFSWVYFVVTHCVLPCCHVCHGFFFVVAHCVLPCCHVCHGVTLLWHTVCFHAVMFLMGLLCCGSLCAVMLSCFSWSYFVVAHCELSCCHACHGVTFWWNQHVIDVFIGDTSVFALRMFMVQCLVEEMCRYSIHKNQASQWHSISMYRCITLYFMNIQ